MESITETVRSGAVWTGESEIRRADGSAFTALQSVSPVFEDDNTLSHYLIIQEDITAHKRSQDRIRYLASHDPLTGTLNRVSLMTSLESLLDDHRRSATDLCVLYLDLDHFKAVNDSYGHDAGDQLLVEIARRILGTVRDDDLVSRPGGDEFVIVLRGISEPQAAERVARHLLTQINQPIRCGEHVFQVGTSIGISLAWRPPNADSDIQATDLLRDADNAMYLAKRSGRNQVRFFSLAETRRDEDSSPEDVGRR